MTFGYVDTNWANAHHDRWGRECQEQGQVLSAAKFARLRGEKPAPDAVATSEERVK